MGNRSNINLVGNTTQGQNVGSGDGVYKGKSVGNILQFKELSVTGTTMVITTDDNNIYFSANTGGGSTPTGTACMLAAYDGAGDLSEGVIITDLTTGALCNTVNSTWCISAKCGDSGSNAGKQLHVCAGNNYDSGTGSGGDLVLSAGDNTTGGAYSGGEVFLSPGIQASVGTIGNIFLGKPTYTGSYVALQACGSQTNVGIDIKSKGNGAMSFDAGASNINVTAGQMIWGNTVYISPSAARISFGNSVEACVCGAPGSSTTGHSLSIMGGAGGTTNFDGGTLILRGGTPNGSGDYGRVRLSNLPACVSETCTVFIDASGNLSTGVGSGGGGLSASSNGLNDNGTTVKLGGDLTETTTISGGSYTYDMCFHQLGNFNICNLGGNVNMNANGGKINLEGCDNNCIVVGLGLQLCQGASSYIQMKNLCPKTSETDVLYINAGGCIFSGATSGGASNWDRVGTCVYPATADDDVRLDCNAYLTWSGTTTCIVAFNSSGVAGNDYFCIKRGSTCISSGPTDQVTVGAAYLNIWNRSSASIILNATGGILSQCAYQNMCFSAGPSSTSTKAGDACICGGQSSSTGNGGSVYIKGGTSSGGADGIICIVGETTATDDITATDFVLSSDERLKTCIQPYSAVCLDVTYKEYEFCNKLGKTRYGVIAQELNETQPELVRCDNEGIMSVSYIDLLVREVASLKCRVCELEKKIK